MLPYREEEGEARTDGRTDTQTARQTDRQTGGRTNEPGEKRGLRWPAALVRQEPRARAVIHHLPAPRKVDVHHGAII